MTPYDGDCRRLRRGHDRYTALPDFGHGYVGDTAVRHDDDKFLRRPAPNAGFAVGHAGPDRLDSYFQPDGHGGHDTDVRLAVQPVWTARGHVVLRCRVFSGIGLVRDGDDTGIPYRLSGRTGGSGRPDRPCVAGDYSQHLSAQSSRFRHSDLGAGGGLRSGARANARGIRRGRIYLALGVFHDDSRVCSVSFPGLGLHT